MNEIPPIATKIPETVGGNIFKLSKNERHLVSVKKWAMENSEKIKKSRKAYYLKNKSRERANMVRWEKENRIERNEYRRKKKVIQRYGITFERYEEMYKAQNGSCAICDGPSLDGRRLHIDHDHNTGTIRGLLCQKCNMGLGCLNDDISLFNEAIKYLKAHKENV